MQIHRFILQNSLTTHKYEADCFFKHVFRGRQPWHVYIHAYDEACIKNRRDSNHIAHLGDFYNSRITPEGNKKSLQ
jgi:hypothetical protein